MEAPDALELASLIESEINTLSKDDPIHKCGPAPLQIIQQRPDDVLSLAHQKLHTWKFSDISLCWRRLYEEASLWKAIKLIKSQNHRGQKRKRDNVPPSPSKDEDWMTRLVNILDMAIILTGAPLRRGLIQNIFDALQDFLDPNENSNTPTSFPTSIPSPQPCTFTRMPKLDFLTFQSHLDTFATPLILTGVLEHWPAISSTEHNWNNPQYLLQSTLGGRRLVPIELGRSYTDENWSQRIMPFNKYLHDHLLQPTQQPVGYLAQHDLFTQIPSLSDDTLVPDYCYTNPPSSPPLPSTSTSTSGSGSPYQKKQDVPTLDEPLKNAWLGPPGTISPLHTDPYHNILCQVVGHKYIRLYSPAQTQMLYPRGIDAAGIDMCNTSFVDASVARKVYPSGPTGIAGRCGDKDEESVGLSEQRNNFETQFPRFKEAEYLEGVLGPGEVLYIPVGWWHYIESLSTSFSVSFWWN